MGLYKVSLDCKAESVFAIDHQHIVSNGFDRVKAKIGVVTYLAMCSTTTALVLQA